MGCSSQGTVEVLSDKLRTSISHNCKDRFRTLPCFHPACRVTMRCLRLPQVNADVFPLLFGNGVGWVVYGSFTHNPYMFAGTFTNILTGM